MTLRYSNVVVTVSGDSFDPDLVFAFRARSKDRTRQAASRRERRGAAITAPSTLGAARSGPGCWTTTNQAPRTGVPSLAKRRRSRPRTDAARDLSVGDTMAGPPEGAYSLP